MTDRDASSGPTRGWSRIRPVYRISICAVLAVVAGFGGAAIVYQTSVQPGAAIVKTVFEQGALVKPPADFDAIAKTVSSRRESIRTPGFPTAHLDFYLPVEAPEELRPVVLWIHGGGFISSSAATVKDYAIMLAHAGYVVASLDYSLAPGSRYPAPILQGNAALRYIAVNAAKFGGDANRIVLGGDSAGAQIAAQLAAVETNSKLSGSMKITPAVPVGSLRGVVLFCGIYDFATVGSSGFPALRTYLWAYTGRRDWASYKKIDQLSTTLNVTAQYPPTFVSVGDADPFRSQASELAAAMRGVSAPVTTLFWNGTGDHLNHEYQFNFDLPQANTAFHKTVAFLATKTKE